MDGLDGGGGAESERKLSRRHVDYLLVISIFMGFCYIVFDRTKIERASIRVAGV